MYIHMTLCALPYFADVCTHTFSIYVYRCTCILTLYTTILCSCICTFRTCMYVYIFHTVHYHTLQMYVHIPSVHVCICTHYTCAFSTCIYVCVYASHCKLPYIADIHVHIHVNLVHVYTSCISVFRKIWIKRVTTTPIYQPHLLNTPILYTLIMLAVLYIYTEVMYIQADYLIQTSLINILAYMYMHCSSKLYMYM